MAGADDVHFGVWHVPAGRPRLLLPRRTGRSGPTPPVAVVVSRVTTVARPDSSPHWCGSRKQVGLDIALARPVEERELIGPQVGVIAVGIWTVADVPHTCGGRGEEVLPQRLLVAGSVGPECSAGLPQRAKAVFMAHRVVHDECDPFGSTDCQAHADGSAVVLHDQRVVREADLVGEPFDVVGDVVERIAEAVGRRRVAMSEAGVVRGDHPVAVAQPVDERLPHPRRRRKAVQQQDRRSVGGTGVAVEHIQVVDGDVPVAGRAHAGQNLPTQLPPPRVSQQIPRKPPARGSPSHNTIDHQAPNRLRSSAATTRADEGVSELGVADGFTLH